MTKQLTDHLGTQIVPGSIVCFAYHSPKNDTADMCYAIVREIKHSKARNAPIFSSMVLPSLERLKNLEQYSLQNGSPRVLKTWLKREGLINPKVMTVLDPQVIPADTREVMDRMHLLESIGPEAYLHQL